MKEFYWEAKKTGKPVPHILGLTASPVIKSDMSALVKLEETLDAVCRSPTKHRDELLAHAHRPTLVPTPFMPREHLSPTDYSPSIEKLIAARNKLNIMEDPYIVSLINDKSDRATRQLKQALKRKDTYVQNTMKTFCRRAIDMAAAIGSWAADWYIFETIRRFLAGVKKQRATSDSWRDADVVYLARVFMDMDVRPPPSLCQQSDLSDKVQKLIEVLLSQKDDAKGIGECKRPVTLLCPDYISRK